MDEQGISCVFEDRLNPSLYDKRAHMRECPYTKVTSFEPRLESPVTRSFDVESSLSANSPILDVMVENKVVSRIMPANDDVQTSTRIKGNVPLLFVLSSSSTLS
ncbi:hypothetical protein LIER_42534 [Lithospermum erythrorhizon]|uniref:Uncharacterized protein n=1 Tax=Lithospermum erythrorhizon TaxID=34254 RepID=A0AAV3NHM2_LITER